ncbi:MAG: Hsp20/alpha crystallin family protein [Chloroflexi bacterium]|nr:Hsp20/alpha crystallin family protein [Chloroflexota bacterium]
MTAQRRRPFGGAMFQTGKRPSPAFAQMELGEVQVVPLTAYDADDDLVFQVPLPGVLPEDIEIECTDRRLVLRAKLRGGETNRRYLAHEWHYGPYEREVDLTMPVDAERANASFSNGILTVSLPKATQTRPSCITLHRPMPHEGHSGH